MIIGYRQQINNMDTDDYNGGHSSSSSSIPAASASASSSVSSSSSSSSTENITNEEDEELKIFERVEHVIEWNDVNRNIIAINVFKVEYLMIRLNSETNNVRLPYSNIVLFI